MKSDSKPDVCVVGLGYIGLPTAAIFARSGCKVLGVDISQNRRHDQPRRNPLRRVDLDALVQGVVDRGLLSASTEVAAG